MSQESWLPRSHRELNGEDYYKPRDGVPAGLRNSLTLWTSRRFDGGWREAALTEIERRFDVSLSWAGGSTSPVRSLLEKCHADDQLWLDIVDFLLHSDLTGEEEPAQELTNMMDQARTLWRPVRISRHRYRLERRVGAELHEILEEVLAGGGKPGSYLREAWRKQFGRVQQPDGAYRDAIRAIEAAIIPAMGLSVDQPTLGKALGALKANPAAYQVELQAQGGFDAVNAVSGALQLLWKSQFDRHGTPDDDVPLNVSPTESEHAVVLATAFVHSLQRGLLGKKS